MYQKVRLRLDPKKPLCLEVEMLLDSGVDGVDEKTWE